MWSVKIPTRILATSLCLLLALASPGVAQKSLSESLPVGAKARLGQGKVSDIQYSPDGTRLAVGGSAGIWLYDARTHEIESLFTDYTQPNYSVAFSPDGRTLAGCGPDGTILLWDISTGTLRHTLYGYWRGSVDSIAFSPDGQTLVSGGRDRNVHLRIEKGVRPDLVVRAAVSASDRERFIPEGVLRLDLGAPVPPLVLEVVSEGSAKRDLHFKKHLYAAAGVSEYLVYDLGGKRWTDSPRELLMYRLKGGRYQQVPARVAGEYRSHVFETSVRIVPSDQEHDEVWHGVPEEDRSPPRFQWWDANTATWRDHDQDHEQELVRLGEVTNALKFLDTMLPDLPERDRALIEARWLELGPPEDVAERLMAAHETPNVWRSLLPDDEASDNQGTQASDRDTPRRPSGAL